MKAKTERLIDILSVPSYFNQEDMMIQKIKTILDEKGYDYYLDEIGNIYVTKGIADYYPLVVAHTDTVHRLTAYSVRYSEDGEKLFAMDTENNHTGIGGDDKAGIFVCLELLDKFDILKVAFFVSEEFGCVGSRLSDPTFYSNVGYAIQFDAPESNWLSHYCDGVKLFDENGNFFNIAKPILEKYFNPILVLGKHPYTDVSVLKKLYDFTCLNYSVGYYNMHTIYEYVNIEDCFRCETIAIELIESLGNKKYAFIDSLYNNQKDLEIIDYLKSKIIKK